MSLRFPARSSLQSAMDQPQWKDEAFLPWFCCVSCEFLLCLAVSFGVSSEGLALDIECKGCSNLAAVKK